MLNARRPPASAAGATAAGVILIAMRDVDGVVRPVMANLPAALWRLSPLLLLALRSCVAFACAATVDAPAACNRGHSNGHQS